MNSETIIMHICDKDDWIQAFARGIYSHSSLRIEGFIHASNPDQVIRIANHFYRGIPGLIVLSIDISKLHSEVRWEQVGDEQFPHIYGPVNIDAVSQVYQLISNSDGNFSRLD